MRILVADDDDYTREGLIEAIDWSDYGIAQVYQARDGEEALRLATVHQPDIVLTDIRMPRLNGIEFAEKLAVASPDSKLLFMSGYMEVDYLKSAIKLSAVDYIEKPIRIPELEKAIQKTVTAIRQLKLQDELNGQKLELEKFKLANMLRTKTGHDEEIKRLCEVAGFPAANRQYRGMAIQFGKGSKTERDRLTEIHDVWKQQGFPSIAERLDTRTLLIVTAFQRQEEERIASLAAAMLRQFPDLTIGIGDLSVTGLDGVADSCRSALSALQHSFYRPELRLFSSDRTKSATAAVRSDVFVEFSHYLKKEPEKLSAWVDAFCDELIRDATLSRDSVQSMFASFAQAMLREKNGILIGFHQIYQAQDAKDVIEQADSIEEIRLFMLELCRAYQEEVQKASPYSRTVRSVMDYIASHYGDADLDIQRIADQLHMSAAHLGALFKQETGTTIKQYISDYRLELAKKLVRNEHFKMNEVAERCGYASASYFAKVFKAATDMTPVEYRKLTSG
ncbi:response regulator [Paenibacillus nanensis]|uniref:Response regulator n=1 Tax=Paenibacillus nanensis TaxID=393251 RepID=A0A3A1UY89_9BACL|nr:response regulator [Paenibacillus nanensis]RIX50290.1 response regulator [Paenibacillus nanensis]